MIEEDIKELRAEQKDLQADVSAIREKLFNGFAEMVTETHTATKDIKDQINLLARTVGFLSREVHKDPEELLAACPFKKELSKSFEKRIKIYLGVGGLLIALVASIPSWIRLII